MRCGRREWVDRGEFNETERKSELPQTGRVEKERTYLKHPHLLGGLIPHLLRVENAVILCVSEAGSKDAGCEACADCEPSLECEKWTQMDEAGPRDCGSPSGLLSRAS